MNNFNFNFNSKFKSIALAATLTAATLTMGAAAHAGEGKRAANSDYYRQQVQRQIEICQSKTALQFSRFQNIRELGRKYGLKLAYLTRQQEQLVTEMTAAAVAAKPYRVSRFITADFYKTLERYNLARR